jgi:1-acyl-sn-glycerol-3-phosphate acyltransferase
VSGASLKPPAAGPLAWDEAPAPQIPPAGAARIVGAACRLALIVPGTVAALLSYLALKGLERGLPAARGPRQAVSSAWGRGAAWLLGIRVRSVGAPMAQGGAMVANHSSWTDILVLLAAARITFVSKAEVKGWPGIGTLARAADTMFIERRRTQAQVQGREMAARIKAGQQLMFFPEATSTDGLRVIPFKTTLFSAFYGPEVGDVWVQPVSVVYQPRPGAGRTRDFYGWWGDMEFAAHIWTLLTRSYGGMATVHFHPAVRAADFADRKALAAHCDVEVRRGVEDLAGPPPAPIPQRAAQGG